MPVQQKGSHSPHCFKEKEGNGIESSNQLWMVEEKPVVRVVVGWGAQRVCLGFRVRGFGFYHFLTVYLEGEQEPSLLCGPFYPGPSVMNCTVTQYRWVGPFSLAIPHITAAITWTMPHG